jgi:hypothetical protein
MLVRFPVEKARVSATLVDKMMGQTPGAPREAVEYAIAKTLESVSLENFMSLKAAVGDDIAPAPAPEPAPEPEPRREPEPYMPRYCDPENEWKGERYEEGGHLDVKDIAKLMRRDIREAIKAGDLPKGIKTSVRISRYSGGRSIDISVTALPEGFVWYTDEYAIETKGFTRPADRYSGWDGEMLSKKADKVLEVLKKIHDAYNRDNSDSMVDYFDRSYYGSASIGWKLDYEIREGIKERLKEEGRL